MISAEESNRNMQHDQLRPGEDAQGAVEIDENVNLEGEDNEMLESQWSEHAK